MCGQLGSGRTARKCSREACRGASPYPDSSVCSTRTPYRSMYTVQRGTSEEYGEGVQPSLPPPRLESTECSGARTSPLTTAMRKSCAVGRSGSALAEHTHR